jgi:phosphatidylserine/phosphatidylglycerophosphate/cardiolipin synthase-like enzyme
MIKAVAPNEQYIAGMTPEEAISSQLVLAILEALHNKGVKQVSRATLLQILGFDEDQITPEDEEVMLMLEDKYLQTRDEVLATLQSRVATKH